MSVCLFVCVTVYRLHRNMRPVSIEPESPEVETFEKNFPEK